jgi:protein TonB
VDISSRYKILLPTTSQLTDSYAKGQQQYIDDDIDLGEALDIDSRNTRWVGYFSHLRTAIEYVWIYPNESVMRGQEGEARVLFVIQEDGSVSKVRLLQSTGFKNLDNAILEAIKLAAPFPPLPKNAEKSRLPVTGTFRYILSSSFASSNH